MSLDNEIYQKLEKEYGFSAPEKTEVIYGLENIQNMSLFGLSITKKGHDTVWDAQLVPAAYDFYHKAVETAKKLVSDKHIEIRLITDITKENFAIVKEISNVFNVRHLDGIKGNFGILDGKQYMVYMFVSYSKPPEQALFSNVKMFVQQQQFLFDTLWQKAIPAKLKITEIEEGIKPDFVETIRDSLPIQKLIFTLLKNAMHDILILFSSANSFHRLQSEGIMKLLIGAAERGVNIRIVVEDRDDSIRPEITEEISKSNIADKFGIRYIHGVLPTKTTTIIVDNKNSLVVETKNDSAPLFTDAIGFATYSNTESATLTHTAIFETYWILRGIKN